MSEAKRTGLFQNFKTLKLYQYRSKANRIDRDFVLEMGEKSKLSFYFFKRKTKNESV
jgi:hypothetical protein